MALGMDSGFIEKNVEGSGIIVGDLILLVKSVQHFQQRRKPRVSNDIRSKLGLVLFYRSWNLSLERSFLEVEAHRCVLLIAYSCKIFKQVR